jgi:hypothetical protein
MVVDLHILVTTERSLSAHAEKLGLCETGDIEAHLMLMSTQVTMSSLALRLPLQRWNSIQQYIPRWANGKPAPC